MVKTTLEDGGQIAPFLMKCYEMVDDPSTDNLIFWSNSVHPNSFTISDVTQFESQLLPKHFKHRNFSSFVRQLNIYGFRKVDTDKWIFANDNFIKGQKNLLKNIPRRKHSQLIVEQKTQQLQQKEDYAIRASEEEKKLRLENEVECLKADKNLLTQELAKLRLHQENSHAKLAILREQIKLMEKDQQQMLSFIVMAMQNPGFLVHILQPKEPNWRRAEANKGVFSRVIDEDMEENPPGVIVPYNPPVSMEKFVDSEAFEGEVNNLHLGDQTEPVDRDLFASETCGPIVIQDQFDDYLALERFLLSSPLREDMEDIGNFDFVTEQETEAENPKMEESMNSASKLQGDHKFGILTERMGHLASECNITP